jgi:hypothetical protein
MPDQAKNLGRKDPELYDKIVKYWKRSQKELIDQKKFKDAEEYQALYDNKPEKKRPRHLTDFSVPIANDTIETGLSVATARIPTPNIKPEISYQAVQQAIQMAGEQETGQPLSEDEAYTKIQEELSEHADAQVKSLVADWKRLNMQSVIRDSYRGKGIKGTHFIKTWKDINTGEKKVEECRFESIFPSPGVYSIQEHTTEPFIYAPIRTIRRAKEMYGIDGIEVAAKYTFDGAEKVLYPDKGFKGWYEQAKHTGEAAVAAISGTVAGDDGFCIPIECYMPADFDDVEEYDDEEYKKDEEGQIETDTQKGEVVKVPVKKTRPMFPSGYKCVTIIYGHKDWIIAEEDCPYAPWGFPQPPFIADYCTKDPFDFYGVSQFKQTKELMAQINVLVSNWIDVVRHTGNAILVISRGANRTEDAMNAGEGQTNEEPLVAQTGEIWREDIPNSIRWLEHPTIQDARYLLEWLMGFHDRSTHLSDAMRGFNQFSQDSGKKIRELRAAAVGTFGPKMDEVVEFCTEIFRMWAWIDANMGNEDDVLLQEAEDENGDAKFNKFIPAKGRNIKMQVEVSVRSLLPDDPEETFLQVMQLAQMMIPGTQMSMVPPEVIIDNSYAVNDHQRMKAWVAKQQQETDVMAQKEQAFEQLKKLAEMAEQVPPQSPQEEQLFGQISQIIMQLPEAMLSQTFSTLPPRIKMAALKTFSAKVNEPPKQLAPQPTNTQ